MDDWTYRPDGRIDVRVLVGWLSHVLPGQHNCLLRLQSTHSAGELEEGAVEGAQLVLTSNQARILGTYLVKLADEMEGREEEPQRRRWLG